MYSLWVSGSLHLILPMSMSAAFVLQFLEAGELLKGVGTPSI